jgi:hypothetical protein
MDLSRKALRKFPWVFYQNHSIFNSNARIIELIALLIVWVKYLKLQFPTLFLANDKFLD